MGEIPTNAPTLVNVSNAVLVGGVLVAERDVLVDEITDGLDSTPAGRLSKTPRPSPKGGRSRSSGSPASTRGVIGQAVDRVLLRR